MTRFRKKLERIRNGEETCSDFILADARDADMAAGLSGLGPSAQKPGFGRTLLEFDQDIHSIIKSDIPDILLTSVSTMERLLRDSAFNESEIETAVRFNDTTDLWRARGAIFSDQVSVPFRTPRLDRLPVKFGLYSMTFSGYAEEDIRTLEAFKEFRHEAAEHNVEYFLEVFNPSCTEIKSSDFGVFLNDMVSRALAGISYDERPTFLKLAFNGQKSFEEICYYDRALIVGIMGGGKGTTRDCFELLSQAQAVGARAALFGRKILESEHPVSMLTCMRSVTDGRLSPSEATHSYHQELEKLGIPSSRPFSLDSQVTDQCLLN